MVATGKVGRCNRLRFQLEGDIDACKTDLTNNVGISDEVEAHEACQLYIDEEVKLCECVGDNPWRDEYCECIAVTPDIDAITCSAI